MRDVLMGALIACSKTKRLGREMLPELEKGALLPCPLHGEPDRPHLDQP